jgi:hypothetical protein
MWVTSTDLISISLSPRNSILTNPNDEMKVARHTLKVKEMNPLLSVSSA